MWGPRVVPVDVPHFRTYASFHRVLYVSVVRLAVMALALDQVIVWGCHTPRCPNLFVVTQHHQQGDTIVVTYDKNT